MISFGRQAPSLPNCWKPLFVAAEYFDHPRLKASALDTSDLNPNTKVGDCQQLKSVIFCRAKFQPPMFPLTCTTSSLRSSRTPWGPLASSQRRRAFQSCQCESSYIPLRIVLLYVLYSFRIKCKIFKTKEDITIKISDQVSALETSALSVCQTGKYFREAGSVGMRRGKCSTTCTPLLPRSKS